MAHLHALLAAESPAAVLIKRGPGRVSCTIGWDRRTDTFVLPRPGWEWAEWDAARRRLVWTEACILYGADLSRDGLQPATPLIDANPMSFVARQAPY
jgi:hypothetical protein